VTIAVNARVTAMSMGGQQRYAAEVLKRLGDVEIIAPRQRLSGAKGHFWEQVVLPWRARGKLLWSPSTTGPILLRHQVVTIHDVAFLDVPQFFSRSFGALYAAITPLLARRAAHIVTVSNFSRDRIIARLGASPERVSVFGGAVSEQFRPQSPESVERTRASLKLPPRYFLLQATSDRRKNLSGALRAWSEALPSLPEDLFLVVSGSLDRARVFGKADDVVLAPRVVPLGFVAEEHMAPLLAGAEVFLFPSLYEGFGLPIVEAMACATPVLTSAATSTQEVAAGNALLVDPSSIADIARGVVELARNAELRRRLAAAGPAHAAKFSWDDVARRYLDLFANLQREGATRSFAPASTASRRVL
jgi:glycosyltransferase involved in cell wall biosynthesis